MVLPQSTVGTVVVLGSGMSGVASVALGLYLRRHWGEPGARWFVLGFLSQAVWCLAYAAALLVFEPGLRESFEMAAWIGMFWTGPLFLAFGLEYTGRGDLLRSALFAPAVLIPAVATGLVLTTPYHDLIWTGFRITPIFGLAVARYTIEPLGFFAVVSGTVGAGVGVLLLVETVIDYGPLYRREATAVALSTALPSFALLLWLLRAGPVPYLNLAPLGFLVHAVLDAYAFVGSGMFETNPTTRRAAEQSLLDDVESPIMVLDTEHRVVATNDAAAGAFDLDADGGLGTPIDQILDLVVDPERTQQTVTVRVDGRQREFTADVSTMTDSTGKRVGYSVVLQDITTQLQRQQRLSVLNRILRHNLRNELNVVIGRADLVTEHGETETVRDSGTVVKERAGELLDISERAHRFERFSEADIAEDRVDVDAVLEAVAAELRERYPDATVETTPQSTTVCTDPSLLQFVLVNLGERALTEADPAHVALSVSRDEGDDTVVFGVTGNGFSSAELTPVSAGEETDLEHTTGISVWVAAWGLTALGGDLSFDDRGETLVASVTLPVGLPDTDSDRD